MDRNLVAPVLAIGRAWSLSARRAWIEIRSGGILSVWAFVALRKESVDRNDKISTVLITRERVALRKESVDRNKQRETGSLFFLGSLSARRAWIEILVFARQVCLTCWVALRKESVDRN